MKVLYLVPYVPNQIRVRPYQLIRSLTSLGHTVTVLTLQTSAFEQESIARLEAAGIQVIAYPLPTWRSLINCLDGLPTRDPLQSFFCWQPALASHLTRLAAPATGQPEYDIVHIEHMRGARFGQHLAAFQRRLPIIWDSVDCISHLFQQSAQHSQRLASRLLTRFELGRSRSYEGRMAALFERVLVTSRADREALLSLVPQQMNPPGIEVLPNGVDLSYFQPAPGHARAPHTLVVSGKMSYHANVSMTLYLAEKIMPLVWAKKPEARLQVVGKDPPASLRVLSADSRIEITGYVEDIRPYLHQASLAVAPLTYGAGIQNKVLEAMACSTPVITTPRATSALQATPGTDLLVAETPEDFACQVVDLLDHPERAETIGRSGRQYVEKHHDWNQAARRLADIYAEEISRKNLFPAI